MPTISPASAEKGVLYHPVDHKSAVPASASEAPAEQAWQTTTLIYPSKSSDIALSQYVALPYHTAQQIEQMDRPGAVSSQFTSGVEPPSESNTAWISIGGVRDSLASSPQALNPNALSDLVKVKPDQIAGDPDFARLSSVLQKLHAGEAIVDSSGNAVRKRTVKQLKVDLRGVSHDTNTCMKSVEKVGGDLQARRIYMGKMMGGDYSAQRPTLAVNDQAISKWLESSQTAFKRACKRLTDAAEAIGHLPKHERAQIADQFENCIFELSDACISWLHYKMIAPTTLGASYQQVRIFSQQQKAFSPADRMAYLQDMLTNRERVQNERMHACRELWSDVNTIKAAFEQVEKPGLKKPLPPGSMRGAFVNMLRSFEFLIDTADLHSKPIVDVRKTSATHIRLAENQAADRSAGNNGAYLADTLLALHAEGAQSEIQLMLPLMNLALEQLNRGLAGEIHSIESGLTTNEQRFEAGQKLKLFTDETARLSRTYKEVSEWISHSWKAEASNFGVSESLLETQLENMQCQLAALHDMSATMVWAGEKTLANSGDRGISPRIRELPPEGWESEEPAKPPKLRIKNKRRVDKGKQSIPAKNAVRLIEAEPKSSSEMVPVPSQNADFTSAQMLDLLPETPEVPLELAQEDVKLPLSDRPGFLEMKQTISTTIGSDLDLAKQARERAQAYLLRSNTAHFNFVNSALLSATIEELRSGARAMLHARDILREQSKPYCAEGQVLFPQFDEDLQNQAVACKRAADWMTKFIDDARSKPLSNGNFRDLVNNKLVTYAIPEDREEEGIVFDAADLSTTEIIVTEKPLKLWNGKTIPGRKYVVHPHFRSDFNLENVSIDDFTDDMILSVRAKYFEHRKISFKLVPTKNEKGEEIEFWRQVPFAQLTPKEGYDMLRLALEKKLHMA